jgi:hypothetical protein
MATYEKSVLYNGSASVANRSECASAPTGGVFVGGWIKQNTPLAGHLIFQIEGTNWRYGCAQQTNGFQYDTRLVGISGIPVSISGSPGPIAIGTPNVTDGRWYWIGLLAYFDGSSQFYCGGVTFDGSNWATPSTTTRTLAQMRINGQAGGWSAAQAAAWTPSAPSKITIGDQTWLYTVNAYSATHIRVQNLTAFPTSVTLGQLASLDGPSANDWAYWPITWDNGAPTLTDGTGNGRDMVQLGTLSQGVDSNFPAPVGSSFFMRMVQRRGGGI